MNADYLNLEMNMAPPARSPLRAPPPPLPSRSLLGMEKVIPPYIPPPQRWPLSPTADTDKPLPQRPQPSRRSSSVYSDESGYTKIIDLYANWKVDDDHVAPTALQSVEYGDALTGLLARRFTQSSSPISPLTIPNSPKHGVSIPSLRLTSEDLPATSMVDVKTAPSFVEFSRSLQAKKANTDSPLSPLTSPQHGAISHETFWKQSRRSSREVRAIAFEYEQQHVPRDFSPQITKVVNSNPIERGPDLELGEQRSSSNFSSIPSSDSSFVVYTGVRESIRAIIRNKVGRKKESDRKAKEGLQSVASANDQMPNSESSWHPERSFSWVSSRRSSLQQGVANTLRSLSLTKPPSRGRQVPQSPRGRQKQLAVPLTPYQKYGTVVWHNSQREKRHQARAARTLQKSAMPSAGTQQLATPNHRQIQTQRSSEMLTAFQSGMSQILDALGETKHKIARTNPEKRRGSGKKNSKVIPAGAEQEVRKRIFRSSSEKRREKLKKSITLVGPVDPYAVEHIAGTDSERGEMC